MQKISEIIPEVIQDIQEENWDKIISKKDQVAIKGQFAEMAACNA